MTAISAPNPGWVVGLAVGTVVGGAVGGAVVTDGTAVGGTVVGTVVGVNSTTLNNVDACAPFTVMPCAWQMYSSGLKDDASTGKDHVLKPWVPATTLTVPVEPLNSPLWVLSVGWNEEETT